VRREAFQTKVKPPADGALRRCFADTRPREFDASRCVVLNNLAELVVRHLEKDIALQVSGGERYAGGRVGAIAVAIRGWGKKAIRGVCL
jgi:hypothetical protein